ncbi:MAG: hypothetical protein IKT30_06875 [Bacteroidaceae bacterium]|nr:hypothetical protein [Bacteroidaceae bacterium]
MNMTLFKISTTDYTDYILADSYQVSKTDVYKTYEDANGATHRRFIRTKVSGKFKMFFRTMLEYQNFVSAIETNKSATNFSVPISAYDNYGGTLCTVNAFIDFTPTIALDGTMTEYMETIDVTIEER